MVASALARVQEFDPTGVAARDLKECLTLQVRALGIDDPIVLRILAEALDPLIKRDFRGVARQLGISIEEVAVASRIVGRLEPRPGRAFGGEDPVYIVPDIYVHKIGDEFHVVLNDDGLPRLRINALYREVLARGSVTPKDTKTYVHEKVRSAMWLIKSIHQRQRTIYRVMQSIIKHQREFFEKGINHLRPLNLRDVADDIEMHESTVSRVTTNKYANTPQGIFELKYFFNSSINRVQRRRRREREREGAHRTADPQRGSAAAALGPAHRRDAQGREHRHRPPDRDQVPRGPESPVVDEAAPGRLALRARPEAPSMKIMDILVKDAVILDLGVRNKRDVLAEMAHALAKVEPQIDANRLLEVLLEREALQSTGIGEGVAIPHGKLPGLDRLLATFARSSQGIDFESIDGQPTHHFFLLVVPEHSGGQYLKALARISRFFRDATFRQRLAEGESLEDVVGAIEEEDAKL